MRRYLTLLMLPSVLLIIWLLLNDSLSIGQIVLGGILAVLLSWAASALRPVRASLKNILVALRLVSHVAIDITKSNIAVARIVWLGPRSNATPGFIKIPLRMHDPHGLAALACIVTYTPGTVWSDYSEQDNMLTLHVLDLKDEAEWLHTIQQRYERPLMEIFE
ncbi:Na+/H+ antiporter subunit E [Pollutimonas harenae]|uniref:Na+/H+ antiporter subunit E n=1 Tax=Pollutimonas harenae TaxID=657015 RepID=A0A853H3E2_9BURK|nr:Na+/H+ antiporter subunit E [Pollutimonas harenae]NYT86762.1 Na+/H+ antiporter subunit E [Pollutimonas harenae]TEA71410.1 Na+/H+ antiporter subunit E [Pollutimonas harenae]